MDKTKVENIIVKFLNGNASLEDKELLHEWIAEGSKNKKIFEEYVGTDYLLDVVSVNQDLKKIKSDLLIKIRSDKKEGTKRRIFGVLKYVAVVTVVLSIGYGVYNNFKADNIIIVPEEAIILKTGDGSIKNLDEISEGIVYNDQGIVIGNHQKGELIYSDSLANNDHSYNEILVPFGRRFNITLSDGTRVFLNAGTSLRYPVHFTDGENRRVYLEGEAYFDVVRDTLSPFIVNTGLVDVRVLGTTFNVSSYEEDDEINVTLVEGAVAMYAEDGAQEEHKHLVLDPGLMGIYDKIIKNLNVKAVNTSLYTSWTHGEVIFRNESFENILRKLERFYNVTIVNNNEVLATENFNAHINLQEETIQEVLDYFNEIYSVDYKISKDNTIIIN